jgi:hypothetical protein
VTKPDQNKRYGSQPIQRWYAFHASAEFLSFLIHAKYHGRAAWTSQRLFFSAPKLQSRFCDTLYLRVKILYISQYVPPEMGAPAARAAELAQHWSQAGHDVSVLTGFPNHPTGVVPPAWRARLCRLTYQEKLGRIDIFRTWLWPLPNRKSHERMRNYASFCLSAAVRGLTLPRPDVIIATSPATSRRRRRMVDRLLPPDPLRFRSPRSLARIARRRWYW